MELQYKIDKLNKELEESKELNEMLIKINEKFRKENDRLYERIDFYKNLRMPRSMKKNSKPKRKHQRNNDSEDLDDKIIDMDAEMDEKDKKDDKDEKDDKDARI
ncbi:15927_t:CDS:2, partial [Rhizophagus irregularis]